MAQMIPLEDYVAQVLGALSPLEGSRLALGRDRRRPGAAVDELGDGRLRGAC